MKREYSISSLLGVTQEDMAMLLNVSRSLYSLYELGKRDLPPRAMQLLADMLAFVYAADHHAKRAHDSQLQAKQQQWLGQLLRENQYQQMLLQRKKVILEKKQSAQLRYLQLREFVNCHCPKDGKALQRCTSKKSRKQIASDPGTELLNCELRLELLSHEQSLLESKLQAAAVPSHGIRGGELTRA